MTSPAPDKPMAKLPTFDSHRLGRRSTALSAGVGPHRIASLEGDLLELAALQAVDRHWANGQFNVDELAAYLEGLLQAQLTEQL